MVVKGCLALHVALASVNRPRLESLAAEALTARHKISKTSNRSIYNEGTQVPRLRIWETTRIIISIRLVETCTTVHSLYTHTQST